MKHDINELTRRIIMTLEPGYKIEVNGEMKLIKRVANKALEVSSGRHYAFLELADGSVELVRAGEVRKVVMSDELTAAYDKFFTQFQAMAGYAKTNA